MNLSQFALPILIAASWLPMSAAAQQVEAHSSSAAVSTDIQISQIDEALRQGRLEQTAVMLTSFASPTDAYQQTALQILTAEYHLAQGNTEGARAALVDIPVNIAADSFTCRFSGVVGKIALAGADYEDAVAAYQNATAHCPDLAEYAAGYGEALSASGQEKKAVEAFRKALAADPENAGLANNLAVALLRVGEVAEASLVADQAKALAPNDQAIVLNADYIAGMQGREPARRLSDSGQFWSRRLAIAAQGARAAGDEALSTALFSRSVLLAERFDRSAWEQAGGAVSVRAAAQ